MNTEIFVKTICDDIIQGNAPWRNFPLNLIPLNLINKKPLPGHDILLLSIASRNKSYSSRWWVSQENVNSLNLKIVDDSLIQGLSVNYYNIDQVSGDIITWFRNNHNAKETTYDKADRFINNVKDIPIKYVNYGASYYRKYFDKTEKIAKEEIIIPEKKIFLQHPDGIKLFYEVIFHELSHYTERVLGWHSYKDVIIERELRAQMTAGFLMGYFGIEPMKLGKESIPDFYRFRQLWVDLMLSNHDFVLNIISAASVASVYLYTNYYKNQDFTKLIGMVS